MKNVLIIFARQPVPGKVKTRLAPPLTHCESARLYQCMLSDVINKTESLEQMDRILFYEGGRAAEQYFRSNFPKLPVCPQNGEDLGLRMQAAFDHVFAMGYLSAAIIGTDSPDLPVAYIEKSFHILENPDADIVFGPAEDGGYYLLAMKRTHEKLFSGISWSSSRVLKESKDKAELLGLRAVCLPHWYDVDTIGDLERTGLSDSGNCAPLTRCFIGQLFKNVHRKGDKT